MAKKAAQMRDSGASLEQILKAISHIRDTNKVFFTVETLNFLQKNGRIGRAQALLGGLLNIKPLLGLNDGKIEPIGRARGTKKAIKELVDQTQAFISSHPGQLVVSFIHIQDPGQPRPCAKLLKKPLAL